MRIRQTVLATFLVFLCLPLFEMLVPIVPYTRINENRTRLGMPSDWGHLLRSVRENRVVEDQLAQADRRSPEEEATIRENVRAFADARAGPRADADLHAVDGRLRHTIYPEVGFDRAIRQRHRAERREAEIRGQQAEGLALVTRLDEHGPVRASLVVLPLIPIENSREEQQARRRPRRKTGREDTGGRARAAGAGRGARGSGRRRRNGR